jgi:putative redox protein
MKPFGRKDDERERRMKAISRRRDGAVLNDIDIRGHHLVADEPTEEGGEDEGPSPLELLAGSLASCTAITMQLYAERKGWDIGEVTVGVDYQPAQRGAPTRFELIVELPKELPEEQRTRLMQIAAKCPVHRTLEGEVMFEERLEIV